MVIKLIFFEKPSEIPKSKHRERMQHFKISMGSVGSDVAGFPRGKFIKAGRVVVMLQASVLIPWCIMID